MQFVRSLYRLRQVIGISCVYFGGEERYVTCRLCRKGHHIDVEEILHFDRVDDLIAYCEQYVTYSVCLTLQGKGILMKEVDNALGTDWNESYLYDIFPNFSPESYYYTVMPGEKLFWVSIIRQQRVNELVDLFATHHIKIVQIFAGPFVLSAVLPQINLYEQHYVFAGHAIHTTKEGLWESYNFDETQNQAMFNLKVADRTIKQVDIDAYATAFNTLLYGYIDDYALPVPDVHHNLEEALARIRFRNNGLLLLGSTFILLLVSTLLSQHYDAANEQLRLMTNRQQVDVQDTEKQIQSLAAKEQLLEELGWNGGISKAWLLDQIGLSLQNYRGVALTDVQINPAPERRRGGSGAVQETIDNRQKIQVQGRCVSLEGLNVWVRQLSNLDWAERVQIRRFINSEIYNDDRRVFTLTITYAYAF